MKEEESGTKKEVGEERGRKWNKRKKKDEKRSKRKDD